jgi:proteasome lid subunit RPN8/RPN11
MLTLANSLFELIKAHALDAYPNECSGLIVGNYDRRAANKIFPVKNVHAETTRTRYLIDPKQYMQIERQARMDGLDVIGIYHSHPDVPAKPSQYDKDHAWPFYTYVIVSVLKGKVDQVSAWILRDDRSAFDEEQLGVVE